jgi:hypothetical protein
MEFQIVTVSVLLTVAWLTAFKAVTVALFSGFQLITVVFFLLVAARFLYIISKLGTSCILCIDLLV